MRHTINSSAPLSSYMFMSQIPSILYTLQVLRVRQPPSASSHEGRKYQARGGRQSRLRASHHSPRQHAYHAQGKTRRMISSVRDPKTRFDFLQLTRRSSFCCFSEHKAILDTSRYSILFPAKIHSFFVTVVHNPGGSETGGHSIALCHNLHEQCRAHPRESRGLQRRGICWYLAGQACDLLRQLKVKKGAHAAADDQRHPHQE
jgi:hypothetical protein